MYKCTPYELIFIVFLKLWNEFRFMIFLYHIKATLEYEQQQQQQLIFIVDIWSSHIKVINKGATAQG